MESEVALCFFTRQLEGRSLLHSCQSVERAVVAFFSECQGYALFIAHAVGHSEGFASYLQHHVLGRAPCTQPQRDRFPDSKCQTKAQKTKE